MTEYPQQATERKILLTNASIKKHTAQVTATRRNDFENSRKRAKAIPGIGKAALALGCHRDHLRAVLKGKRVSTSLMQRYAALKAAPVAASHKPRTKSTP